MVAGDSAIDRANELRRRADALYAEAGRYEAGGRAEQRVARTLMTIARPGWTLLADRQWPDTRGANVDIILVGPPGVFVIDVKNWRDEPRIAGGHLKRGEHMCDDEIGKLRRLTRSVADALSAIDMVAGVVPMMVFDGHRLDAQLRGVRLVGAEDAVPALESLVQRLSPAEVRAVVVRIEAVFPAYDTVRAEVRDVQGPVETRPLFDVEEVIAAQLRAARAQPIEHWMTFLHPEQVKLVRRSWGGPARVSGAAGTGKTVVGLHRAIHLARQATGKILFVTVNKTLPKVLAQFAVRMAPEVADRIEFTSLHAWASRLLRQRGRGRRLADCEDDYGRSWWEHRDGSLLPQIDRNPTYWRDEINYVIQGRGIRTLEDYQVVTANGAAALRVVRF